MSSLKDPIIFGKGDKDQPLYKTAKKIIIIKNKGDAEKVYNQFYNDLNTYLTKISNSPAKTIVNLLVEKKLVHLGFTSDKKITIIGRPYIANNKLAGIVLDAVALDIELATGETANMDDVINAIYFLYIRSVVGINQDKIKKDEDLHDFVSKYLYKLILSHIHTLDLKGNKKLIFSGLIHFFFYRLYLHYDANMSMVKASKKINSEILEDHIELLKKYSTFKDIYKSLIDFNIVRDRYNSIVMNSLRHFKMFGFLSISTSLDYMIATMIISSYFPTFIKNTSIDTNLQSKVEQKIIAYGRTIKYDINAVKHI